MPLDYSTRNVVFDLSGIELWTVFISVRVSDSLHVEWLVFETAARFDCHHQPNKLKGVGAVWRFRLFHKVSGFRASQFRVAQFGRSAAGSVSLVVSLLALSAGGWLFASIALDRIAGSLSCSRRPVLAESGLDDRSGRVVCVLVFDAG